MTDNEIKEGLRILQEEIIGVSVFVAGMDRTRELHNLSIETLNLINRLQARVEKCEKVEHFADKTFATLQAENERLKSIVLAFTNEVVIYGNGYYIKDLSYEKITYNAKKCLASIKAEAYKEFAEKVKEIDLYQFIEEYYQNAELRYEVRRDWFDEHIDNILKEKVGEDK